MHNDKLIDRRLDAMKLKTRLFIVAFCLLSVILFLVSCSSLPEPLPWAESYGRFYTRDLARAQEEIPFPIVLPSYVPDNQKDAPLPGIDGPLRGYQHNNEVQVKIYYSVYFGGEVPGTILISEYNYPVVSLDPKLNPGYEPIEIHGKQLIKREGNYVPGPGVIFYFNHENIYYVVRIYNLPIDEALKVVESMID